MHNTPQPKGKAYYNTGAILVAFGIIMFTMIATLESLYSVMGNAYYVFMGVVIVSAFVGSLVLTRRAVKNGNAAMAEYYITGILRFVASSVMIGYAFTKLNNGHMYVSYSALDTKLTDLSDFDTVWSFYGRYSSLQALVGLLELVPALMLLFRRTAFAGSVFMLPVAANIMLLNIYFRIGFFTLPVVLLVVLFCCYILYSYKEQIAELLRKVSRTDNRPAVKPSVRILGKLRFVPVLFFLSIMIFRVIPHHRSGHPKGAYELTEFIQSGRKIPADSLPLHAWRKIYLEKRPVQSSVVNGEGKQGAGIHYKGKNGITIAYRHGALDIKTEEEKTGAFTGQYMQPGKDLLVITGRQDGADIEAHYKRMPLREFIYWWER